MIYFRSKRQAKGIWRIHLYDRTIKAVDGLATFEKAPPAMVFTAMRLRGFKEVDEPGAKPPVPQEPEREPEVEGGGEKRADSVVTAAIKKVFKRKSKGK